MVGVSLNGQKSFTNVPFYAKSELEIFKQAVESYSPNIFIEYDPNFKFTNEYKGMKIYNTSIDDLIYIVDNSFLKEIYYKYPNNIFENARLNFLLLINNLKQEKETSMYMISKSTFISFLASQDSIEPDLLKKFINELNVYYSSDNSKNIIEISSKDDQLYNFIGYTKEDLDKFINDYPSENYLKGIYTNLIKIIEVGKDIAGDSILQL